MPPKRKSETSAGPRPHVLDDEQFTTDQFAHDVNISVRTVLRMIKSGKLRATKVGKQYLISRAAVREWWDEIQRPRAEARPPAE